MTREQETGAKHTLKCWPEPFQAMVDGDKTFEFRKDDRDFHVGDLLFLVEWDPSYFDGEGGETERALVKVVTYVLRGRFGVPEGYCVMALADPEGEERCSCTNCPVMVPRAWASGMCAPCAAAHMQAWVSCDHRGAEVDAAVTARDAARAEVERLREALAEAGDALEAVYREARGDGDLEEIAATAGGAEAAARAALSVSAGAQSSSSAAQPRDGQDQGKERRLTP